MADKIRGDYNSHNDDPSRRNGDTTNIPPNADDDDDVTSAANFGGAPPPPLSSWSSNNNNNKAPEGRPGPPPPPSPSTEDRDRSRWGGGDDQRYYGDNPNNNNHDDDGKDEQSRPLSTNNNNLSPTPPPATPTTTIQPITIDPQDSKYDPIHYNFGKETKQAPKKKRGFLFRRTDKGKDDDDDDRSTTNDNNNNWKDEANAIPETFSPRDDFEQRRDDEERRRRRPRQRDGDDYYEPDGTHDRGDRDSRRDDQNKLPDYASPRRDVITRYQSTARGKCALALSCGMAGSVVGAALGKSILNRPYPLAAAGAGAFVLCTLLRNPYGELVRALGMALILALQRTTSIRRRYSTWKHIKASLGAAERQPFPPNTSNPWAYQPERSNDPAFRMLYSVIAMAFVGSTCGGSVPLIPTWIGSLAGAGFFALSTTMQSARGDLARSMGMRVVALCEEMLGINSELEILRKGGVVSGKVLDKVFILDRKHRIKDRLIAGATFAYRQINSQMNRVQGDMNDDGRGTAQARDEPGRGRPREDDDRRGRPRDDGDIRGQPQRRDEGRGRPRDDDDRRGSSQRRDDDDRRGSPRDDYERRGPPQRRDND